jgi:hypothetical protein
MLDFCDRQTKGGKTRLLLQEAVQLVLQSRQFAFRRPISSRRVVGLRMRVGSSGLFRKSTIAAVMRCIGRTKIR